MVSGTNFNEYPESYIKSRNKISLTGLNSGVGKSL